MASQIGTATGKAKLEAVTSLVEKLTTNLDKKSLSAKERDDALEELKIYGRDPRDSDPIFTKEGIHMLLQYAFDWTGETARAAQRVLANSMLLQPPTRQMFVDFGFDSTACSALKSDHFDSQFLVSRIIFFSTYGTTVNLSDLLTNHALAQNIISDLAQHAKLLDSKPKGTQDQMQDMALAELLKLLFNITHFCRDKASLFDSAVKHIVPLFWKQEISDKRPLDPPFGPLVNALINLDFSSETAQAAFFPKDDATKVVARLSVLLDKGLKDYTGNDLEAIVAPLTGVISDLYEQGPEAAKADLRQRLLPTAEDRKNVLGKGDTLPSRLLKNSANPLAPKLATAISHLLFDLSDRDGHKFVENVGYGFASGFLFQNNIPVPASAQDGGNGTGQQRAVNPITGQFLDEEVYPDEIPMTDEEKEREAERLFVLFERLKRTGIVDIQNPVEQAVQQGKFRELKDDEVEELD